jgi:hypothetical protein
MPDRDDATSDQIGAAIRAAGEQVAAPDHLRARIASERLRAAPSRRRRYRTAGLAAAGAAVAAVLLLVLVLAPGSPANPSVADAADAALRPPSAPAPAVLPTDPRFVDAAVEGLRFPNYAYRLPWQAVGTTAGGVPGRAARTVVYARGSARVGYTIVGGRALEQPAGAREAWAGGVPVRVQRRAGAVVVSWERAGHTCVLASRNATVAQLLRFVAWHEGA